jgi:hypothetical protein
MPFINWARSAGGGLVDRDLPVPAGDCARTVTARRKATTVSGGGASLEQDIISVEIMPPGADLIPNQAVQIGADNSTYTVMLSGLGWHFPVAAFLNGHRKDELMSLGHVIGDGSGRQHCRLCFGC